MNFFAYIDPATGSLFIQAAIGGLLAVGVVFRKYIKLGARKAKVFFDRALVNGKD